MSRSSSSGVVTGRALRWKAAAAGNSDERRQPRLTGLTEDQSRPESNPNRMPGIKAAGRALREGGCWAS